MYDVIIIGAGVSGLTAGIVAHNKGQKVLMLEYASRVGQKLLLTGNGKANLSNIDMSINGYNNQRFAKICIDKSERVYQFFDFLGVKTKVVGNRIYPYSESATTVLNAMRRKLNSVDTLVNSEVTDIDYLDGIFIINNQYRAKSCVLCTGSEATKGKNSLHLVKKFGHDSTSIRPAIVPLTCDTIYIKGLSGVRAKVMLSLICGDTTKEKREGEILFKDNGISGIVSMELSSYIARNNAEYKILIDFAPDFAKDDVKGFLDNNPIDGMLHSAIALAVEKQAESMQKPVYEVIKSFELTDIKLGSIKNAQVVCGGLDTDKFDDNLQSVIVPNLYACGEALNIDGDCGGYNLHWAFLSGIIVAENLK